MEVAFWLACYELVKTCTLLDIDMILSFIQKDDIMIRFRFSPSSDVLLMFNVDKSLFTVVWNVLYPIGYKTNQFEI